MLKFEELIPGITEVRIKANSGLRGLVTSVAKDTFEIIWKTSDGSFFSSNPNFSAIDLNSKRFIFTNPDRIKEFLLHGRPVDLSKVFP
jgi:hypothetical protein